MTTITDGVGADTVIAIRVMPGWFWKAAYSGTLTTSWVLD
jgi:hypothetical protein